MKKQYISPLFTLPEGSDPGITLNPSERTSGYVGIYKLSVSQDIADLIELNGYDDIDFAAMDTNSDRIITDDEVRRYIGN